MVPTLASIKFAVGFDCNRDCGFCLQLREDRTPIIDLGMVRKVLDDPMVRDDVRLITLTGGEPLFTPYRYSSLWIVDAAHRAGKETCIFTNGDMLSHDLASQFRDAGLSRFRVTLYDPVDPPLASLLMRILERAGFPRMVKYTVTKENFHELPSLLERIGDWGVEWFQVKPFNRVEVPEVDERYELEPSQVLDMARILLDFKRDTDIRVDLLPLCYEFLVDDVPMDDLSPCNCGKGPRGYLVIGPTGEVRICGAYPDPIGDANTDSISDLWENHPLLHAVRTLGERKVPAECEGCEHWDKCVKTDCHSATFSKHGNFEHANPQCPRVASTSE